MKSYHPTTLDQFYKEAAIFTGKEVAELLPPGINKEIGHFNIFDIAETIEEVKRRNIMPYNRRAYYKISLIKGRSTAEYADKVIEIDKQALLFASPKVPYHWIPKDAGLKGSFCIFTTEFLVKNKTGVDIDQLPIFQPGGLPVFELNDRDAALFTDLFARMREEINSDYPYKYDLLRNYVLQIIHLGQKLQPLASSDNHGNALDRVSSLFIELLERQFPIESPLQTLSMRTPSDYAGQLAIHVNYLNKALKESTGKTTTSIISQRVAQEAKILLKQTDWNISEIAYSLGFDEVAHFSNFFKKQTTLSPTEFRA